MEESIPGGRVDVKKIWREYMSFWRDSSPYLIISLYLSRHKEKRTAVFHSMAIHEIFTGLNSPDMF